MSEIKTNQTFVYTGSSEYSFNNVVLDTETGFSLYSPRRGNGGINEIPYNGATVTMKTGTIGSGSGVKDLQPSMNNKLYYLVTNILYTEADKDTVISLATEVPVSIVSWWEVCRESLCLVTRNNYTNLYLIWDYYG